VRRVQIPYSWRAVNISDAEVDELRDGEKEIQFEKVFQWCLPRYGDNDEQTLFGFQAARMRRCEIIWKREWFKMIGHPSTTLETKR
jgi:hypothetical protein